MIMGNLAPWHWGRRSVPIRREEEFPFFSLQSEINRLFDRFFSESDVSLPSIIEEGIGAYLPKIDMMESETELKITAELPGMEEKDINVSLLRDVLTINGEKKEEIEEKDKGHYRMERKYGSVHRSIPLPCEIEADKVDASFKNGVLTIKLPKSAEVQKGVKTIPVKKG